MAKITWVAVVIGLIGFVSQPALGAGRLKNGPTVGDCISDGFYGNEPEVGDPDDAGPSEVLKPDKKAGQVSPNPGRPTQSVGAAKKEGEDPVKDCKNGSPS